MLRRPPRSTRTATCFPFPPRLRSPHVGRGGWTWYTGAACWLYRLIVESLLGLRREAGRLHIAPCLPAEWKRYGLRYRFGETLYRISVVQAAGAGMESRSEEHTSNSSH